VVREPMFLLLLGAGAIYLLMGDPHEALVLLGFVVVIIGVTVLQERRTDARWQRCATCPARVRWCCATGEVRGSRAARWCAATSCCSPKATGCRPTAPCCRRTSWRSTSRC
jgi:hypothetical protein